MNSRREFLRRSSDRQRSNTERLMMVWVTIKVFMTSVVRYIENIWNHTLRIISKRKKRLHFVESYSEVMIKPRFKERVLDVFLTDYRRQQRLMKWVNNRLINNKVHDFHSCWQDGITFCALLESICPGVCPSYHLLSSHNRVKNCRLGLKLANKYLYVPMDLLSPEEMAIATKTSEHKIIQYISMLKWASENIKEKWASLHESLIAAKTGRCFAKGSGLRNGIVGKRSKFTIIVSDTIGVFNLLVEVRGPNNEYCGERLVSIHQAKGILDKSFDLNNTYSDTIKYLEDCTGNTFIRKKVPPRYVVDKPGDTIHLDFQTGEEGTFYVTFVPRRAGMHTVAVKWQNHHVESSPFRIKVYKASNLTSKNLKGAHEKRVIYDSLSFTTYSGSRDNTIDLDVGVKDGVPPTNDNPPSSGRSVSAVAKSKAYSKGRQLTVTRRRVLRRIITRNGEEIVIEEAISPSLSRQSSFNDNSDEDNRNQRKDEKSTLKLIGSEETEVLTTEKRGVIGLGTVPEERQGSSNDFLQSTETVELYTPTETESANLHTFEAKNDNTTIHKSTVQREVMESSRNTYTCTEINEHNRLESVNSTWASAIETSESSIDEDKGKTDLAKDFSHHRSMTSDETSKPTYYFGQSLQTIGKGTSAKRNPLKRTVSIHSYKKPTACRTTSDGPMYKLRRRVVSIAASDISESSSDLSTDDKKSTAESDRGNSSSSLKMLHSESMAKTCAYICDKAVDDFSDANNYDVTDLSQPFKQKLRPTQSLPIMRKMWETDHDVSGKMSIKDLLHRLKEMEGETNSKAPIDDSSSEKSEWPTSSFDVIDADTTTDQPEFKNIECNRLDTACELSEDEKLDNQDKKHLNISSIFSTTARNVPNLAVSDETKHYNVSNDENNRVMYCTTTFSSPRSSQSTSCDEVIETKHQRNKNKGQEFYETFGALPDVCHKTFFSNIDQNDEEKTSLQTNETKTSGASNSISSRKINNLYNVPEIPKFKPNGNYFSSSEHKSPKRVNKAKSREKQDQSSDKLSFIENKSNSLTHNTNLIHIPSTTNEQRIHMLPDEPSAYEKTIISCIQNKQSNESQSPVNESINYQAKNEQKQEKTSKSSPKRRNFIRQESIVTGTTTDSTSSNESGKNLLSEPYVGSSVKSEFERQNSFKSLFIQSNLQPIDKYNNTVMIIIPKPKVDKSTQVCDTEIKKETGWDIFEGMYLLLRRISLKVPYISLDEDEGNNEDTDRVVARMRDIENSVNLVNAIQQGRISGDESLSRRNELVTNQTEEECTSVNLTRTLIAQGDKATPNEDVNNLNQAPEIGKEMHESKLSDDKIVATVADITDIQEADACDKDKGDNAKRYIDDEDNVSTINAANIERWFARNDNLMHQELRMLPIRQFTIEANDSGFDDHLPGTFNRNARYSLPSLRTGNGHMRLHRRPYRGQIPLDPKLVNSASSQSMSIDRRELGNEADDELMNNSLGNDVSKHQRRRHRLQHHEESFSMSDSELTQRHSTIRKRPTSKRNVYKTDAVDNRESSTNLVVDRKDSIKNKVLSNPSISIEHVSNENINEHQTSIVKPTENLYKLGLNKPFPPSAWKDRFSSTNTSSVDSSYCGFGLTKSGRNDLLSYIGDFQNLFPTAEMSEEEMSSYNCITKDVSEESINESESENVSNDRIWKLERQMSDMVNIESSCSDFGYDLANVKEARRMSWDGFLNEYSDLDRCPSDLNVSDKASGRITGSSKRSPQDVDSVSEDLDYIDKTDADRGDPMFDLFTSFDYSHLNDIVPRNKIAAEESNEESSKEMSAKVAGVGIQYGVVGQANTFQVWLENPTVGSLSVNVIGPPSHTVTETSVLYTGDNLYVISFEVTQPGFYKIFLKWGELSLGRSPYICEATL